MLNEDKRSKLFDWLTQHGVEIDPLFEEKLKELQKQKDLEQWEAKQPKTTAEVEGYEQVEADLDGAGREWINGEDTIPEGHWEFWVDKYGILHKRGEE